MSSVVRMRVVGTVPPVRVPQFGNRTLAAWQPATADRMRRTRQARASTKPAANSGDARAFRPLLPFQRNDGIFVMIVPLAARRSCKRHPATYQLLLHPVLQNLG